MSNRRLTRELGVFSATMLGLGSILGTGIFVSIGIAADSAIFAIDGRVEGLEMFDSPTTFSKMFEKLIRSYALDALETGGQPSAVASPTEARALLETLSQANSQTYPAAGLGQEVRINTDELVAGGLQVDDTLVHLVAFEKQHRDTPSTTRRAAMLRASLRRQNREAN